VVLYGFVEIWSPNFMHGTIPYLDLEDQKGVRRRHKTAAHLGSLMRKAAISVDLEKETAVDDTPTTCSLVDSAREQKLKVA
jgi:hypothetical protein